MANMIHYKHRTYLTSTAIRGFELILEPQFSFTVFIDYIHNNTSSDSSILRYLSVLNGDAVDSVLCYVTLLLYIIRLLNTEDEAIGSLQTRHIT